MKTNIQTLEGFLSLGVWGGSHKCLRRGGGGDRSKTDISLNVGRGYFSATGRQDQKKVPSHSHSQGQRAEPVSRDSASSGKGHRIVETELRSPTPEPRAHSWFSSHICLPTSSLEGSKEEAQFRRVIASPAFTFWELAGEMASKCQVPPRPSRQGLGPGWPAGETAGKLTPPECRVICFSLQL